MQSVQTAKDTHPTSSRDSQPHRVASGPVTQFVAAPYQVKMQVTKTHVKISLQLLGKKINPRREGKRRLNSGSVSKATPGPILKCNEEREHHLLLWALFSVQMTIC